MRHVYFRGMTVPERLRVAMRVRGVSGRQLERQAGLSNPLISRFLSGKREELGHEDLAAICAALRIEPKWLLTGEGEMEAAAAVTLQRLAESPMLSGTPELELAVRSNPGRWPEEAIAAARVYSRQGLIPDADWSSELDDLAETLGRFAAHKQRRSYEKGPTQK